MTNYPWQKKDWQAIANDFHRRPNAWLFYGKKGIGKVNFARSVAMALLCKTPLDDKSACHQCTACHWFNVATHPDFYPVFPGSFDNDDTNETTSKKIVTKKLPVIKIEAIQAIINFAQLSSHQSALRIVLIESAEKMTPQAANTLLKTLEEPSNNLLFLLVTDVKERLFPTIKSRCRLFELTAPSHEEALNWVMAQDIKEPEQALAYHGGSPLFDYADNTLHSAFIQTLCQPKLSQLLEIAAQIEQQKLSLSLPLVWLSKWLFDLIALKLSQTVRYHQQEKAVLKQLVQKVDTAALFACYDKIQTLRLSELHTLNVRLQTESLLVAYRHLFVVPHHRR